MPVCFELIVKDQVEQDAKTGKTVKKSALTKNDYSFLVRASKVIMSNCAICLWSDSLLHRLVTSDSKVKGAGLACGDVAISVFGGGHQAEF